VILPAETAIRQTSFSEQHPYCAPAVFSSGREQLLPELWRMLHRRRRVLITSLVLCLLLSIGYVLIKGSRYEATAEIEVSPVGTNSMGLDEMASRMLNPSDPTVQLQSAVTVLESNTVALAVIQQTKLAERADFAGRWRQPAGSDVAVTTPDVRDHLLRRFAKNLKVESVPKTDIIRVQFRARDPELAAQVVNATVSSYAERNFRSSYDSAAQVSNWLSSQMEDLKLRANQAQEKLAALQRQRGLIGIDETDNIVTDKLKDLNEQLTATEADRIVKEARYRIAGSGNPELIASAIPEPTLQVLRSQQAQLRVEYARLSTKFGEGYPKLAELGNQMAQVDSAIDAELKNLSERYRNEYLAAASAEKMLQGKFEEQKQKAYDLSEGAAQYAILKHEVETTQDLYQTLQLKLKQAGIVAGLASANIGVVESGQAPSEPVDPNPWLDIPLGIGAGVFFGFGFALTGEVLDTTIRNHDEAEAVMGLPTLAEIPEIAVPADERRWLIRRVRTPAPVLVACSEPRSAAAESYRSLRTSLMLRAGHRPRVMAVTSSVEKEGRSLTSLNYAVVLAQQGARVLLVDADLRCPSLHQAFDLSPEPGLATILRDACSEDEAYARIEDIPNLTVVPAGNDGEAAAEKLTSERVLSLLETWRARFDYVILDTPPAPQFSAGVVLACHADAVLLVVRCGVATKDALRQTRDVLQRANVNIAGLVLNGIDPKYERSYFYSIGHIFPGSQERAG